MKDFNENDIDKLKELISENKIDKAFQFLLKNRKRLFNSVSEKELLILSSDYKDIKQREMLGLSVSRERINDLSWKLLHLVDQINSKSEDVLGIENLHAEEKFHEHFSKNNPFRSSSKKTSFVLFGLTLLGITLSIQIGASLTSSFVVVIAIIIIGVLVYGDVT